MAAPSLARGRKVGGATRTGAGRGGRRCLSARGATRPRRRDSLLIGLLLDTRGLTELVVLNVGLEAGVIGPRLYAPLVVTVPATTAPPDR